MKIGTKVRAVKQITESGALPGDVNAKFPSPGYIHAEAGEEGEVIGVFVVRFNRTGTATDVSPGEVSTLTNA